MSFINAVKRADLEPVNREKVDRQRREDIQIQHEHNKYWDSFFKARVNDFALETNNEDVWKAYNQMINGRNTNAFYSENNYINKI